MAKIHVLPGIERRDLVGALPVDQLLRKAMEVGLTGVVVVGTDRTGKLYVAGSYSDADKAVGVLMRGVTTISEAEIVNNRSIDASQLEQH